MNRREALFTVISTSLISPLRSEPQGHGHDHGEAFKPDAAYAPRFFSTAEYMTIKALCARLIPDEPDSPGALAAGVPWYLDTILFYSKNRSDRYWHESLSELESYTLSQIGLRFADATAAQQDSLLFTIGGGESAPLSKLEIFFTKAKATVVEGFTLSDLGMSNFWGYRGNQVLATFPGCNHQHHHQD